jgi:hypothetical protein
MLRDESAPLLAEGVVTFKASALSSRNQSPTDAPAATVRMHVIIVDGVPSSLPSFADFRNPPSPISSVTIQSPAGGEIWPIGACKLSRGHLVVSPAT